MTGALSRLRRAFAGLSSEQRRVGLAALLVLVSLCLPWYSKSLNGFDGRTVIDKSKMTLAITVPSFVEASIFLVAVAIVLLMFFRGEGKAFHLPFGDGIVCTVAGGWVGFLVFYRFIDHPGGGKTNNLIYSYQLSWGIFFGLLAAAFLIYSGNALRSAHVAEPPLPGEPAAAPAPTTVAPVDGDRERRRAERAARRGEAPTAIAPLPPETTQAPSAPPRRPDIDGGTQLSFDEQE